MVPSGVLKASAVLLAEQYYAVDLIASRQQAHIGAGCHRAGIDVAGVGHDDGLGHLGSLRVNRCLAQIAGYYVLQLLHIGGVEHAGDSRGANAGHAWFLVIDSDTHMEFQGGDHEKAHICRQ